ncbi:MAG: ATP synthase subunit I [Thiotrichaceae bacterium]|nr:ATP synthase subunit I [Thiotrichaceae bacterium]
MSDSEKSSELANNAKKTILLQLGISLAIAAGFLLKDGSWVAISAFYGGLVSVATTTMLSRGINRASVAAEKSAQMSQVILYLGAVVRFVLVLVMFGIGLGALEMAALPLIIGFVITQLVFVLMAGRQGREKQTSAE